MLRACTLLFFALAALGQVPRQPARVSIDVTADGTVRGTLTAPAATIPTGLPEAFARAIGCDVRDLEASRADYEVIARCPAARPSPLTFHTTVRLFELAPRLLQAGAVRVDFTLITPPAVRVDPPVAPQSSEFRSYHLAEYSLDQLPVQFTMDGGFETGQVRTLGLAALGWILAPFLLLLLRPSDLLRLRVQVEGIFVLGWIAWIWVLSFADAGPLLSYLFAGWALGPMLALLAPPLGAVWIGSRLAAREVERLTPNRGTNQGISAADYRRMRFWSGVAATCLVSTLLSVLFSTFAGATPWPAMFGLALTAACVLRIWRMGRGKSRAIAQGALRQRAFDLASRAGVPLRGVSIVTSPTPRPPFAVATRWGVVVMNDGLLTQLSRREVDAVMCHELSHLRPANRSAQAVLYVLLVAAILGSQWAPRFSNVVPLALLAVYFLIKAWRRAGERKADRDAVRWSGDPEAMLTGLARVAQANNMPLDWGAPISWMLAHPPTMGRLRAIARAGGLDDARTAELLEESRRPALDHYDEAQAASLREAIPEDAAFSPAMRERLTQRLTWYVLAAPLVWGFPTVWLLERLGLSWWAVFAAASALSAAAIYAGSDWIVASNRRVVKQRALVRHGPGLFAGFSPSAEPRVFDGQYHYDVGMVRFVDGVLEFAGDRTRFTLDRRLVERVWLGDGPRHWMARKVVYIECRPSSEAGPVIFSLQPFEAWIWPETVRVAKKLYRDVDQWHKGLASLPAPSPAPPLPCPLPHVEGAASPFISFRTAFRSVTVYSGIAFLLVSMEMTFEGVGSLSDLSQMFIPVSVCGLLAFVVTAPRLNWGRMTTFSGPQTRLPAGS